MLILPLNASNYSQGQPSFNGLHIIDPKVQKLLLKSLDNKQLVMLSELIKAQENNSVHILLGSENGRRLNASLICDYRLKNLKPKYKQLPVFESKINFIKRVVNIANKYKIQIKNLEVSKLKWIYSSLPEWTNKMYSK